MALVVGAQAMVLQEIERRRRRAARCGGETRRMGAAARRELGGRGHGRRPTVVGHLAGPGEKVFVTLEGIDEPDVALLALTPDTRRRTLRIPAAV